MGLFVSYCDNCHKSIEWFLTHDKNCKNCGHELDQNELLKTMFKPWQVYRMKTNFELVKEFHAAFNKVPDPKAPTDQPNNIRELRTKLIFEEATEVFGELGYSLQYPNSEPDIHFNDFHNLYGHPGTVDLSKLAKELADLLYVVYGTAAAYGIPIDDVYREVHRSNMSKLGEDGKPIYREDGKVLKGPNYSKADVKAVLCKHNMHRP